MRRGEGRPSEWIGVPTIEWAVVAKIVSVLRPLDRGLLSIALMWARFAINATVRQKGTPPIRVLFVVAIHRAMSCG
ncbi:hypothetical protein AWV80_08530 [Cupriavidus sp. UYMU48A]|nr:hypothetical protein AWV80_08530 [Cupriavidus sp. UYMU48A]